MKISQSMKKELPFHPDQIDYRYLPLVRPLQEKGRRPVEIVKDSNCSFLTLSNGVLNSSRRLQRQEQKAQFDHANKNVDVDQFRKHSQDEDDESHNVVVSPLIA